MSRRPKKPGDYPVGYGRPPSHTRFRKGVSGNPGGRPRGMTAVRANRLALQEAYRLIPVREGDEIPPFRQFRLSCVNWHGSPPRAMDPPYGCSSK